MKNNIWDAVSEYLDKMVGKTFLLSVNEYREGEITTQIDNNPYKQKEVIHRKLVSWDVKDDGERDYYVFTFDESFPSRDRLINQLECYSGEFETVD
jgi:hypothetical protein